MFCTNTTIVSEQLADKSNAELIDMVASLELELLDYADRFLSDNPNFDQVFPIETLEKKLNADLDAYKAYLGLIILYLI